MRHLLMGKPARDALRGGRVGLLLLLFCFAGAVPIQALAEKQASPEPAAAPAEKRHGHPETLLDFAISGGWMMIPLGICSIIWVGFFVERLIVLRRRAVAPRELLSSLRDLARERPFDRNRALAAVRAHRSAAAAILEAAIERLGSSPERLEKGVQNVAAQQAYKLRENLWIFAIISTVAPLLGLLGTVVGLVQAFREVAITGLGAGSTLAPGIYEALVATVAGLATAIPAMAIYYWLHARVDRYMHEIDGVVVEIVEVEDLTSVPT